jgi:mannose-6-phosphate isomerase-like protein (cupin superfamily)
MITKGRDLPESGKGRRAYPLTAHEIAVRHLVTRVTGPDNPFGPHKHEQPELWFILDGHAVVSLDGQEHGVESGDLIEIAPWVEHGLRTDTEVRWICLG